ncbi:MAG: sulfotransferase [Actinobacteria bacterium]|nr:sulfotransferase [Actinomycetota bacterium]
MNVRPVFIGGCSRSGTTLLAAMLGSSPDIVTVPEAEFKWDALKDGSVFDGQVRLGRLLDFLAADPKFAYWDVALPRLVSGERDEQVPFAAVLSHLAASHAHAAGKPEATMWVDHTPGNIRYVSTLAEMFPAGRFVHIVRDGRGVASSVIPLDFGPNTVAEAADYWSSQVSMGLAATAHVGDERAATVRFEDLVQRPRAILTALCDHLGVAFDDGMLHRRDYRVQSYTADQHELVARPPDPLRSTAWRTALTPRDVEIFEARTGELLRYLGYVNDYGITARDLDKREHLTSASRSLARRLVTDRVRRYLRRRRPIRSAPSAATGVKSRATT